MKNTRWILVCLFLFLFTPSLSAQKGSVALSEYVNNFLWNEGYLPHSIYKTIKDTKGVYYISSLGNQHIKNGELHIFAIGATYSHSKRMILVQIINKTKNSPEYRIFGKTTNLNEIQELYLFFNQYNIPCKVKTQCYDLLFQDAIDAGEGIEITP
ncbi:MAG: hypothetical protein JO154_02170 [Chitinophaga sp.]|uniref:hypothetical protein n=1 Tax=Chitinophaga sp. TaxID=1869181 RepID=UPI0025C41A16|nr:hypothetical protein [Chitinophaga sp.]MBV8251387.1 hypothetical protein [Chitinophaga sp.]